MARFREGTGTSLLVAIASLGVFASLAWAVVVLLWIALSVYAIVEMFGDGRPSALAVLLIVVMLVATLSVLFAVGVGLIGRSLAPKRRGRDRRLRRRAS